MSRVQSAHAGGVYKLYGTCLYVASPPATSILFDAPETQGSKAQVSNPPVQVPPDGMHLTLHVSARCRARAVPLSSAPRPQPHCAHGPTRRAYRDPYGHRKTEQEKELEQMQAMAMAQAAPRPVAGPPPPMSRPREAACARPVGGARTLEAVRGLSGGLSPRIVIRTSRRRTDRGGFRRATGLCLNGLRVHCDYGYGRYGPGYRHRRGDAYGYG